MYNVMYNVNKIILIKFLLKYIIKTVMKKQKKNTSIKIFYFQILCISITKTRNTFTFII